MFKSRQPLVEEDENPHLKWRANLERQTQKLYQVLRQAVTDLHSLETRKLDRNMGRCASCREAQYDLDLVEFICAPDRRHASCPYRGRVDPPHHMCHQCIARSVKKYDAFLKAETARLAHQRDEEEQTKFIRDHVAKIIPCTLCKTPNVLTVQTVFNEGVLRRIVDRNGTITQYLVHVQATKVLQDNFSVSDVYENQRRPFFGTFSANNLLTIDFRGNFSNENGIEIPNDHQKPNKSWVWLEVDRPDLTLPRAGENGWMYSHLRFDPDSAESQISLFHFVRTRRLLHTRIRVSDAVKAELQKVAEEVGQREKTSFSATQQERQAAKRRNTVARSPSERR
jgi:hypothetical protein